MPSYFPTPGDYILERRKERSNGNTNLFEDGLQVNFRRKPWDPLAEKEEAEDFVAATLGDPEFKAQDYFADAQVPSANAETVLTDAKVRAAEALEKYGPYFDPATKAKLAQIAESGHEPKTTNWFTNALNVLDTPGELIRLGIADLFTDTESGVEITGADYWDSLRGREDRIRERMGDRADAFVGEGQFLSEGSRLLKQMGMGDRKNAGIFQDLPGTRAFAGLVIDIITDPFTYVSFATVGLGKKVAMTAAQEGLTRAGREAVEAVAEGTVKNLTDTASKHIAERIGTRVDDAVKAFDGTPLERQAARDRISRQIVADERRAYQAAQAPFEQITPSTLIGDTADDILVPRGTVIESVSQEILPLLADKQFRTIAKTAPWYSNSSFIPGFAKGGVQLGAPFGRKRFPMLRIPGTETNRLASRLLGRNVATNLFERLPNGAQTMIRQWGERTGVEKEVFKQAKEGSLWRVDVEKNLVALAEKEVFTAEALRPLAHGLDNAERAFKQAGRTREDAHRALSDLLNGDTQHLDELAPELRYATQEGVFGDAEKGIEGLRDVLNTFFDAARRVGMDIGRVENYAPIVVDGKFGRLIDSLVDTGVDLAIKGSSPESELGLAVFRRYLYGAGESALSGGGRDLGYAQFARENKVTQLFRSGLGGVNLAEELALSPPLAEVLSLSKIQRLTPYYLNEAIDTAMADLVRAGKLTRKQADAFDNAFEIDLAKSFTSYASAMGEATRFRDLVRRLKRVDLMRPRDQVVDISATLATVRGRLSDDTARFIDDMADGVGSKAASRLVSKKVGGRTFKVPAAVAASPQFKSLADNINRTFSLTARRTNEMRAAVSRAEAKLIAEGVPEEIAQRLALAESSVEVSSMLNELADIALHESDTIQRGALELTAKGYSDSAIREAVDEAHRIIRGASETMDELEGQVRRTLNLPDPAASGKVIDFSAGANAPMGYATPLQYLHSLASDSISKRSAATLAKTEATLGLRGATRPQLAREAVADLADRLTIANVTVGDLAEFSSPRVAARILVEINDNLLEAGYRGVDSLTDEMLEGVSDLYLAEFDVLRARAAGEGVEAAERNLVALQRNLDEIATPLTQSGEMLGDAVDHIVQRIEDVNHPILMPTEFDYWREVWAVAIQKTGLGDINEGVEAAARLTRKELTQRDGKGFARELADSTRALWNETIEMERTNLVKRISIEPRTQRVLEAMASGDVEMLGKYMDEFRAVVGGITDKGGRPLFDGSRFTIRPDGRLVYEAAEPIWVTLDDVMPAIRQIADDATLSDLDALSVVRATWDDNPSVIENTNAALGSFFRQLDEGGGLPSAIEDYEYLRSFIGDLAAAADELGSAAPANSAQVRLVRNMLDETDSVLRGANPRKLLRAWDASQAGIRQVLPAEEWEKLNAIVSLAAGTGRIKPSKIPAEQRALLGSLEEARDRFSMDLAMLRRQSMDLGEGWAASVADDAELFRNAFDNLLTRADDLTPRVREGVEFTDELGGEFADELAAVRKAGVRLRKNLRKTEKDKRLALFLPELPEDTNGLGKFLQQMDQEMRAWEPIKAGRPTDNYIAPEFAGLMGQTVEGLEMTPGVALMLENLATGAVAMNSPLGIRMTADAMREFEKWWKGAATVARPTFVPRNVMGGVVNGLLIGVGPRHYAAVNTNVMKFRRLVNELGVEGAIKELPKNFQPYMRGLWDSGLLVSGFSHTLDRLDTPSLMRELINPASSKNAVFQLGGKIMESSEDFLRAAAFVRWYDPNNPASARLAKEMALAVHFDYSSLTRMETSIKRFVPFFIWTRRNLPLQMRAMIEQPGHITRLNHIKENINAEQDETFVDEMGFARSPYLSAFAMRTPFILNEDTPFWQRLLVDPDIPVHDLEEAMKAFSGGPGSWVSWGIRSVSPRFTTPFESGDYDVLAPVGLREILMATDWMHPFERVGEDYEIPAQMANVFNTVLPFLGEWTRLAGVLPRGGNAAARAGYNIEDGVSIEERILASALTLGRAGGAQLQTPADSRAAGYAAIDEVFSETDLLKKQHKIVETDDLEEYINTLLRRAGLPEEEVSLEPEEELDLVG